MITHYYTIFDAAVNAFMPPFQSRADGEALRQFTDAMNDEKSHFNRHPHDYTLFYIASFDDESATFELPTAPRRLISGTEVLIKTI